MESTHRIKIKIGDAEFEAEGKPELVKQQFEGFMAALAHGPSAPVKLVSPSAPSVTQNKQEGQISNCKISKAILDRVFRQDDPLSLMAIPATDNPDADALLVLVYGYTEMTGNKDVTGTALVKSAGKTGLNVDRISRTVDARRDFIRSSGVKKGTRYSLNNRGIAEAERLILAMVE